MVFSFVMRHRAWAWVWRGVDVRSDLLVPRSIDPQSNDIAWFLRLDDQGGRSIIGFANGLSDLRRYHSIHVSRARASVCTLAASRSTHSRSRAASDASRWHASAGPLDVCIRPRSASSDSARLICADIT